MVSANGESGGELFPVTVSVNSTSNSPRSGPSSSVRRSSASAVPPPGGTRQSTSTSACEGMTLSLLEAEARVGTNVTRSIGSAT